MDSAYRAKYLSVARMLWNASEGDPSKIPQHYAEHLSYEWSDGDISLVHLLPKFDFAEDLEPEEIEEAIEMLGKVKPDDWPFSEDIEQINVLNLLKINENLNNFDFVEDNLSLSETVTKVLKHAIESVFGSPISYVRSKSGDFPSPSNQFLQDKDGTFQGTFEYEGNTFDFEVFPSEEGWTCTYRMSASSLKNLPPLPPEDDKRQDNLGSTRRRGR